MELRIIIKDPADGDPLDMGVQGVWADYATIGFKFTKNGENYGEYFKLNRGASFEEIKTGALLMLESARDTANRLQQEEANDAKKD